MKGRHSWGFYRMFIVAIRPSTFLQALSSRCVVNNCPKSFWCERNSFTFTCHPEDSTIVDFKKGSAVLFVSCRSLMRSEISFCVMLCDWGEVTFSENSGFLEVEGRSISFVAFRECNSSVWSKTVRDSWNMQTFTKRYWNYNDDVFGYSTPNFFLFLISFWIGGTVQT